MKHWKIILYALVGAFFTGGIIFSITSTFTSDSPFSWLIVFLIMAFMFLVFLFLLLSYKRHRPSLKDMEDRD